MKTILKYAFILTFLLLPAIQLFAQRPQAEQDAAGSRDDGIFSRYPGAVIEYYQEVNQYYFVVTDKPFYSRADATYVFPVRQLKGDVIRLLYTVPLQNTPDNVYQYYYNALENSHFEILFAGKGSEELGPPEEWYNKLYEVEEGYNPLDDLDITLRGNNHHYISARSTEDDGTPVYVSIFVEDDRVNWDFTIIMMDIIHVDSPEAGSNP